MLPLEFIWQEVIWDLPFQHFGAKYNFEQDGKGITHLKTNMTPENKLFGRCMSSWNNAFLWDIRSFSGVYYQKIVANDQAKKWSYRTSKSLLTWLLATSNKHPPWNSYSTWKWMVGIRSFPFGAWPVFKTELLFRECSSNHGVWSTR